MEGKDEAKGIYDEPSGRTIRDLERQDAKTIPIIAMTANAFREDAEKCMEAGMIGIVFASCRSRSLIVLAAVRPSITGIITSIKITSYVPGSEASKC